MSRYFMIQSWVGSHENEPDYNGQQCGERNVRSSEVVPLYDRHGNANTQYFSDEAIAERMGKTVKKPSVSIEDKILPQAKRVRTLTQQLIELEEAKKAGMDVNKYSKLRDILICKRQRAEVLLQKALSVKPSQSEDLDLEDTQEFSTESYEDSAENGNQSNDCYEDCPQWLLNVKTSNCFRKPLIKACKAWKACVKFKHEASKYIQTLKEI